MMKTFNLHVFLFTFLFLSFSASAQEEKEVEDSIVIQDSHVHRAFQRSYRNWSDNRVYANGFDNSSGVLCKTYAQQGYTVQYDSQGHMNIYFWDRQFGYQYDENSTATTTKITNPLNQYELVQEELHEEMKFIVQKQEIEAYNKGLAWRGSPGHSSNNGSAYNPNQNHPGKTYSAPNGNGSKSNTNTKKNFKTNYSGGSDPYSRSAPRRVGHTLSK